METRLLDPRMALEQVGALAAVYESAFSAPPYGYTGAPGQWWHERARAAMDEQVQRRWLEAPVEMLEALLDGLPHRRAVLSAPLDARAARALYRSRGWVDVVPELRFAGDGPSFAVMGLELAG
jgi:hypothetical protein